MIVALVALAVLLVPLMLIGLAVRLTSPGPAIYTQWRVGQGGREFRLLKFRTMRADAGGSALTVPGDQRVTPLGRVLRASCVDELPQLINVLLGQMTLVGPRPQTPGFAARYPARLRRVFDFRPGLTGPGVVRFNDEDMLPRGTHTSAEIEDLYLRIVVPKRAAVDLDYCRRPTMGRTFAVLGATALLALRRVVPQRGAVGRLPGVAPPAMPDDPAWIPEPDRRTG